MNTQVQQEAASHQSRTMLWWSLAFVAAIVLFISGVGVAHSRNAVPVTASAIVAGASSGLSVALLSFLSWLGLKQHVEGTLKSKLLEWLGSRWGTLGLILVIAGVGAALIALALRSQYVTFDCKPDKVTITLDNRMKAECGVPEFIPPGVQMVATKPGYENLVYPDVLKLARNGMVPVQPKPHEEWTCVVGPPRAGWDWGSDQKRIDEKVGAPPAGAAWKHCDEWPLRLTGHRPADSNQDQVGTGAEIMAEQSGGIVGVWLHSDNSRECEPVDPAPGTKKRHASHKLKVKAGCADRSEGSVSIDKVRLTLCTMQEARPLHEVVKLQIKAPGGKDPLALKCKEVKGDAASTP
jgi:hypothetical protein